MDCPRCKLPLKSEVYEGQHVELCQSCWGAWVKTGDLEAILLSRQYSFDDQEKQKVVEGEAARSRGPITPIACPQCGARMARLNIETSLSLVVDRCPRHGVWLDTGEIKTIQAVAEKSKELCQALIKKIRGQA